ncbi:probable disease resistance RPP8-like protein 2 [Fagus crenata]
MENSRKAWKDKMKIVVHNAITCLPQVTKSQKSNTTHYKEYDHPWQKFFSAEIELLIQAIEFLSLSIEECRIELRKETNSVVSLEEDVQEMVSRLTTNSDDQQFSTHSIVEMEGTGKTTLASEVMPNHDEKGKEKDYSFNEVMDVLKGKKYLLVLDKISNKETWDALKEAFRDSKNGAEFCSPHET